MPELATISPDRIDDEAAKVVRRLLRYGHEAYLVGGCVRDLLLDRDPKDFDVSTSATPEEIKKLFRNCRIIGRRFRLAHIFFQGKKIIETSTFRDSPHMDPAAPSDELLIRRDNIFGTAEQDAVRRDFTINGLFYDLKQEKVIDYVDGLADLRSRTMRTIGDPRVRFQEDPVRILRAIRFAARLGLTLEPATEEALIEFRGLIAGCAPARIIEEIYRLLGIGHSTAIFRLLHETGVMAVLFPELRALLGPPPNPQACVPVLPMLPGSSRMQQKRGSAEGAAPRTSSEEEESTEQLPEVDGNGAEGSEAAEDRSERQDAESERQDAESERQDAESERQDAESPLEASTQPGDAPGSRVTEDEASAAKGRDEQKRSADPKVWEERAERLVHSMLEQGVQGPCDEDEPGPPDGVDQLRPVVIQRLWDHLAALDRWLVSADAPPSHAVMLSAPLLSLAQPVLQKQARPHQIINDLEPLISSVTTRLQVSRKDKDRLKEILLAQRRLTSSGRRGRPMALVQRDYFVEAFQLLQISVEATGEHQEALARWQRLMEEAPSPKRRKRRRGGRRRPRGPQA